MTTAKDNQCQEYEKWVRLMTLIDFAGRHLCYDVLFKREQLPIDGSLLYAELEGLKSKICRYADQLEIAFPSSKITDHNKFDLTLFTSIIQTKFGDKYKKLVDDLRQARNKELHRGSKKMLSDTEFNMLWNDITNMLQSHGFDLKLVIDLKSSDLLSHRKFKDLARSNFLGSIYGTKYLKLDQLNCRKQPLNN